MKNIAAVGGIGSRNEHAALVKLVVVGDIGLGHLAFFLPAVHSHGAVVELAAGETGHTHHQAYVKRACGVAYIFHGLAAAVEQCGVMEQVAAGVARHRKLGKYRQLRSQGIDLTGQLHYGAGVGHGVGHRHGGHTCRDSKKTVFHRRQYSFEYAKVQIFQLTPKKFAYYEKNELLCTLF